jgi:hypothetical protein
MRLDNARRKAIVMQEHVMHARTESPSKGRSTLFAPTLAPVHLRPLRLCLDVALPNIKTQQEAETVHADQAERLATMSRYG